MESLKSKIEAATKKLRLESEEWRALLAGIGEGKPPAELQRLGAAACLDSNQLAEVKGGIARGKAIAGDAVKAPKLTKEWAAMEAELAKLQARFDAAASNQEREQIGEAVDDLQTKMKRLRPEYVAATLAAAGLVALKREGLA